MDGLILFKKVRTESLHGSAEVLGTGDRAQVQQLYTEFCDSRFTGL